MRNKFRSTGLALALLCSAGLAGCHTLDCDPAAPSATVSAEITPKQRPPVKRAVAKRVAEPRLVPAGAKLRSFCGQRHIRFQKGGLQESASEKARNDVLCRQVYSG